MQLGWIFVALILAGTAADTPADIAKSIAEKPPTDIDTYYAMKTQLGSGAFADVESQVSALGAKQAGVEGQSRFPACLSPDWQIEANAGIILAAMTDSDAEWASNHARINQVTRDMATFRARIMAGEAIDPMFAGVAADAQRAANEKDLRASTFARRIAEDQFGRLAAQVLQQKILWATDINPKVQTYLLQMNTAETCRTDRSNTNWLKADVKANGWPRLSREGPQMANDAWLLIQHADHDVAFQKEILPLLEALLPSKEVVPHAYALLYDRVATAEKRLQRYGTQGRCVGEATWEPLPVEDPDHLDERRAKVGLGPEADYKKLFPYCTAELAKLMAGS
jgi:hypothetical protein